VTSNLARFGIVARLLTLVKFDGQGYRSKFKVTGGDLQDENIFDYACTLRGETKQI